MNKNSENNNFEPDVDSNPADEDASAEVETPDSDNYSHDSVLPDELFSVDNLPSGNPDPPIREAEPAVVAEPPKSKPASEKSRWHSDSAFPRPVGRAAERNKILLLASATFLGFLILIVGFNLADSVLPIGMGSAGLPEPVSYTLKNQGFEHYVNNVNVSYSVEGGETVYCSTPPVTVGEFIDSIVGETKFHYGSNYSVYTPLEENMNVEINRVTTETVTLTETIAYESEVYGSQTIPQGTRVKVQSGINGLAVCEYKKTYVNGEADTSELISINYLTEPQTEIIYEGTGGTFTAANGVTYEYSYYIDVEATAYGVDTGFGGDSDYVASGKPVDLGMIAVDPNMIPLGSRCYVTGSYKDLGVCYAEDIGGAIVGNRIDVYLGDDLEEQIAFGRRDMRVYVLK